MDYTPGQLRILKSAQKAQRECLGRLRSKLAEPDRLTPRELLTTMIADYEGTAIMGCDREHGGDMLLAQWGTYDFFGQPEYHFDVTRQFIITAFEDGPMTQLGVTLRYEPRDELNHEGNIWNAEYPTLEAFRHAVEGAPGFQAVADRATPTVSIDLDEV
jgi:hypothetical protein